jgi:aspartyl-tRNA(Asn)/glutamyl-tRNA(Gln) amidotransferase subunit A
MAVPTIREVLALLEAGQASAVEVTTSALDDAEARNSELNAFITLDCEGALVAARRADQDRRKGQAGALAGVPLAIKDNMLTAGLQTTAASKILEGFVPPFDGTAVARLRAAGAVIVGKTNCDEFAMGSSNENSAFGCVQNPAAPGRTPGGSSGGSAAAVAACLCAGATGTDTGGSIRLPASFTGTVGFKPTYGRISRFGVVAFASSLDQVGPLARTVWDVAKLTEVMAGHDPRDSTSVDRPVDAYTDAVQRGVGNLAGVRVGVPREYFVGGNEPAVESAVRRALDVMADAGAAIVEISLPHTEYAVATYYLIATAEASSNLARYDGMRYGHRTKRVGTLTETIARSRTEGFGPEVIRRVLLGTYALSAGYYDAYYLRAQKVRTLIRRDFERAFDTVDVVVTPTSPCGPFALGERVSDPLQMYLGDVYTTSCNLAGLPGISLPCGRDAIGSPIGLQILAPWFAESSLLAVAAAWEALHEEGTR